MLPQGIVIALAIGTAMMLVPILVQSKWHGLKFGQCVILTLILLLAGVSGIYLWFFVENFEFGGRSLYGSIFVVPIALLPCSKLLKVRYATLTDVSAPAGCIMFAVMKIKCLIDGCCAGKMIYRDAEGVAVYFPSQKVEAAVAVGLFAILMYFSHNKKMHGYNYACFFILYGATRFVLNFFRRFYRPYLLGIPAGHVWSIVAVAIGVIWIAYARKKNLANLADSC